MSKRIEEAIAKSGKSLYKVSHETGIAMSTLYDWKNGKIKDMKFKKLKIIANALGTTPDELTDD